MNAAINRLRNLPLRQKLILLILLTCGTVLVLAGTGFQTPSFERLPPAHMYHATAGLERTGRDFTARMIAAEALSRT